MNISQLIKNVQRIDVTENIKASMQASAPTLVEAQQKQMLQGKTSTGGRIGKYKDKKYRQKKFAMNPLAGYGNIDLRFKGYFQRGIKVYFFSTSIIFTSTDSKTEKLVEDYGEEIFGLNNVSRKNYSRNTLAQIANQMFIEQIHKR